MNPKEMTDEDLICEYWSDSVYVGEKGRASDYMFKKQKTINFI